MRDTIIQRGTCEHVGVVLDISNQGFDCGSATFGSILVDQNDSRNLFMYYTGAQDVSWSHAAIGLATSRNGLIFKRIGKNPILEGAQSSFCFKEAVTPAVTRIGNRFYMVFSGRPSSAEPRRLGIAYADDPRGPWHIIGELIRPTSLWEGRDIDNGPSLVKLSHDTVLVFYSNVTSWRAFDIFAFFRRYPVRKIGIAKIRIRGTSMSNIEVHRFQGNPLKHLNGAKGSWNESLFCPGYIKLHNSHNLFPAASTYSFGSPHKQYIGMVIGDSPYFGKALFRIEKLINGPSEKYSIIPYAKSEISLDSPAPLLRVESGKLFLYYSVMDQADQVWKIALTTFALSDQFNL